MLQTKILFFLLLLCCLALHVSCQLAIPPNNHYPNNIQRRQFWSPPLPPLDGPLGNRGYHRNLPMDNIRGFIPSQDNSRHQGTKPYGLPSANVQNQPPIPPIPHLLPIPFPVRPDSSFIPRGLLPQQACHGPHCDNQGNPHVKIWKRRIVYPERRHQNRIIPFQPHGLNQNSGGEAYGVNYEYDFETPRGK